MLLRCSSPRPPPRCAPADARVSTTKKLDVVVVGGGISGLATALELARRGRSVRVVSRDLAKSATLAAGGMLAPQAERLDEGPSRSVRPGEGGVA